MAEALRTLLVLDNQAKAARVLRELTVAGYEPLQVWVKSGRSLSNALRHRSWDLLIADSLLWKELNRRDPRLQQMQPRLPALLIAEEADPEQANPNRPGAEQSGLLAWSELEALASVVRRLLAGQAEVVEEAPAARSESPLGRAAAFLRRYYGLIAAILVGAAATVTGFVYYQTTERVRLRSDFETMANERARSLRVELARHETVLHLLGAFFEAASEAIPGDFGIFAVEFREFSQGVLAREPHLQAVVLIPRLTDAERPGFEQASRVFPGYRIREVSETGAIRPATRRSEYYPVLVVEPRQRNAAILGLDLATVPGLREAIAHARETGKLTASGKNRLPDPQAGELTVWQFLPVYEDEAPEDSQGDFRPIKGFAALVFRVDWPARIAPWPRRPPSTSTWNWRIPRRPRGSASPTTTARRPGKRGPGTATARRPSGASPWRPGSASGP